MRHKIILTMILLLAQAVVHAYDFQAVSERHVLSSYRKLAQQTAELDAAAEAYCSQPTDTALSALQDRFRSTFLAWQSVQHLRFGPVQYLARENRFAFWPDERGVVGRHLGRLLEDPALRQQASDIGSKSVAVQGLSAMERLLFTGGAPPDAGSCLLLVAIGANLHDMADGIVRDWTAGDDPYVRYFITPGPSNPLYTSAAELAGTLLNSLHTELELILTQKLARPLDRGLQRANGKRVEGWRSNTGLPAISANLEACHALYRHAFAAELAGNPPHALIEAAFERASAILHKLHMPLSDAVKDPGQRDLLVRLQAEVSALKQLVAGDLATTLNLSLGFNSLDGD